jgi:beta-N-acetylhexosaminidase
MTAKNFITGLSGPVLTGEERELVAREKPCGLILFDRNIEDREQLRRLIGEYCEAVGEERQLVLIDQEGGRIQRMRPPVWRAWPAAARYGELWEKERETALEAARLVFRLMMEELREVGFNVDCAPVLDIPRPGAHEVIGDRAFGTDLKAIIELGRAVAEGCMEGGVLPVIKHLPGHGRANADSHEQLPVIDASRNELERSDFIPFRALRDMPLAMTGHLLLRRIDPNNHVSVSPLIISEIIRGHIGFDGLLMSDDIHMEAMAGGMGERASEVLAAGCDVALYCKGEIGQMREVAQNAGELTGRSLARFNAAFERIRQPPRPFDRERAEALLARLS